MIYWFVFLGLVLLVVGGNFLVRGTVALAYRLGVSSLLISLTLIGFGTSIPELIVSIRAALAGSPGIVVGNVVGSNISNSLFVLGLAALIYPMSTPSSYFRRDGIMVILSTFICVLVALYGYLDRVIGTGLVLLMVAYMVFAYQSEQRSAHRHADEDRGEEDPLHILLCLLYIVAGLAMVIFGARWLVDGAIDLARMAGISETIVGLTIVAIGTSLPELVTSLVAAMRGATGVAFGNILGSNIQNILSILGITAIVQPIVIPLHIAHIDIWVMLSATLIMLFFAVTRWRLNRIEGGMLLTGYILYLGYLAYIVGLAA